MVDMMEMGASNGMTRSSQIMKLPYLYCTSQQFIRSLGREDKGEARLPHFRARGFDINKHVGSGYLHSLGFGME